MSYRIIIPVFNPPASLLEVFEHIENGCEGALASVILVDDGSTNGVPKAAVEKYPQVTRLEGDGSLWWGGGIRLGMEKALDAGADVIFWLNHDCLPDPGAIDALYAEASRDGVGCVSAWCYCIQSRDHGVNPGFRNFQDIPKSELEAGGLVRVDGTNGNCVALNANAVRFVGLPRAQRHPHYGDGPYLYRLHQGGFENYVLPEARAALDREFERCISEHDHSTLWNASMREKMAYYWGNMRSKYHWKNKFWDIVQFRGPLLALPAYVVSQAKLFGNVLLGHLQKSRMERDERVDQLVEKYSDRFPRPALREALDAFSKR